MISTRAGGFVPHNPKEDARGGKHGQPDRQSDHGSRICRQVVRLRRWDRPWQRRVRWAVVFVAVITTVVIAVAHVHLVDDESVHTGEARLTGTALVLEGGQQHRKALGMFRGCGPVGRSPFEYYRLVENSRSASSNVALRTAVLLRVLSHQGDLQDVLAIKGIFHERIVDDSNVIRPVDVHDATLVRRVGFFPRALACYQHFIPEFHDAGHRWTELGENVDVSLENFRIYATSQLRVVEIRPEGIRLAPEDLRDGQKAEDDDGRRVHRLFRPGKIRTNCTTDEMLAARTPNAV